VAYARSDRMVGRRIADEFVIVPLASRGADVDSIYDLNEVAACVWEMLDGVRDGHAIVAALVERFEVDAATAERDYRAFLGQLVSIDAVRPAD
jgi:hypothetical protein